MPHQQQPAFVLDERASRDSVIHCWVGSDGGIAVTRGCSVHAEGADYADAALTFLVLPNVRAKATAEEDADWPRKDDTHWTWSGQAVAAVVGRRLSEGLGRTRQQSVPAQLCLLDWPRRCNLCDECPWLGK